MKKLLLGLGTVAAIAAPVANIVSCGFPEYVVLPIKEPWASMIADGIKPFEFRSWIPKWAIGKKILIVATGKAKSPREIIAVTTYNGSSYVIQDETAHHVVKGYQHLTPDKDVRNLGGWKGDTAIILKDTKRIKPILLSDLGIMRTPQKYQYWSGDLESINKYK